MLQGAWLCVSIKIVVLMRPSVRSSWCGGDPATRARGAGQAPRHRVCPQQAQCCQWATASWGKRTNLKWSLYFYCLAVQHYSIKPQCFPVSALLTGPCALDFWAESRMLNCLVTYSAGHPRLYRMGPRNRMWETQLLLCKCLSFRRQNIIFIWIANILSFTLWPL